MGRRSKEIVDAENGKSIPSVASNEVIHKWLMTKKPSRNPETGKTERLTRLDSIVLKMIKKAEEGNVLAAKELLDRAYGKAVSAQEGSGSGDQSLIAFKWGVKAGEAIEKSREGKSMEIKPVDTEEAVVDEEE